MGIESFCWANYPFFSSEGWQFFVSFLLRYWSPYSDIDKMIQETKMSYVWPHNLLESSIVCLLSELEEFSRS